jgi:hypothetical protein
VVFFSWESRCVGVLHAPDVRARGNIVGATGRAGGHGWALGTRWAVAGVRRRRRQAAEQGGLGEGARTGLRGCGCLGHERGGRESACGPREHAGRGAGRGKGGAPGGLHAQAAQRGEAGWASAAGWATRGKGGGCAFLFPIFLSFLFSISYYFKSSSLLNACFVNSLIKQNKITLQHDVTIKALIGF